VYSALVIVQGLIPFSPLVKSVPIVPEADYMEVT
jgi:hypothetical protein